MALLGLPYCGLTSSRQCVASSSVETNAILSSTNHLRPRVYLLLQDPSLVGRELLVMILEFFAPHLFMRHTLFTTSTRSRTTVQNLQILFEHLRCQRKSQEERQSHIRGLAIPSRSFFVSATLRAYTLLYTIRTPHTAHSSASPACSGQESRHVRPTAKTSLL
jgi:hypothetical protein